MSKDGASNSTLFVVPTRTDVPATTRYRIVRATENVQFSPAPRYTFSRGDELSSDNQIRTPRKRALPAKGDGGFFFSSECSSTLYDQYTRKMIFPLWGVLF